MSAEEHSRKKLKMSSSKKIGTHNGSFHLDESMACYMLKLLPEYSDATIIRSRDPAELDQCDIVVDVGAEYVPEKNRFDHHQRGFSHTFSDKHSIKLSSAGLIYKHFGHHVIQCILPDVTEADLQVLYWKVYDSFVLAVDAIDNGVTQYSSSEPARYVNHTDLASRVGRLNPDWNEKDTPEVYYDRFLQASQLAGTEFVQAVKYYAHVWLPARGIVEQVIKDRHSVDASGEIIALTQFCPWKSHLFELEPMLLSANEPKIKFVLYSDQSGKWRVQTVPIMEQSFESRMYLPEGWRGFRDAELCGISGIDGCIFVHANGFIGGNETYAGALAMARASLKMHSK